MTLCGVAAVGDHDPREVLRMLFLSLNVLVAVTIVVIIVRNVRTVPDGPASIRRGRRRAAPTGKRPAPAVPAAPVVPAVPAAPVASAAPVVPAGPVVPSGAEGRPESLEGMLTALLLAGEITRLQYRYAAEEIAARDVARHPLTVPPDSAM
jgi:hypothetical protein